MAPVCSTLRWIVSVTAWKISWTWNFLIFSCLVFTEDFVVDFRTRSITGSYTSFLKNHLCILLIYLIPISYTNPQNFAFDIFGNYRRLLNFAVVFPVYNVKHQNILSTPTFAIFPLCAANTTQKIKFSIEDFFSKCDQIRRKLRIWSHLLKKPLMENFPFCTV